MKCYGGESLETYETKDSVNVMIAVSECFGEKHFNGERRVRDIDLELGQGPWSLTLGDCVCESWYSFTRFDSVYEVVFKF